MCGICGQFAFSGTSTPDIELVLKMNSYLQHRGPDDSGYYVDSNIAIAMKRLAIINPTKNNQPLKSDDNKCVIVFNGEIYNYPALKAELESEGVKFANTGDTEVVLKAYQCWGKSFLKRLNGMFALAIWDTEKSSLLLARDAMGQKPLFWSIDQNTFAWSSEVSSFFALKNHQPKLNSKSLEQFLNLEFIADPLSIYEGVNSLGAGQMLELSLAGRPIIRKWWNLEFEPKSRVSKNDLFAECRMQLKNATERALIADRPLGIFLSGGIDSSLITGLASESIGSNLKTYSLTLENDNYSEEDFSTLIAEYFKTHHQIVPFSANDFKNCAESCLGAIDQPIADPALLPLYHLSKIASTEIKVTLTGDGGDETLAGYSRYVADKVSGYIPRSFASIAVSCLSALGMNSSEKSDDFNFIQALKRISQVEDREVPYLIWKKSYQPSMWNALFNEKYRKSLGEISVKDPFKAMKGALRGLNRLDAALLTDQIFYLAGDLLPKTDRASMLNGLEARAPFLDSEWVEWTARLPEAYKLHGFTTKYILRKAFDGFIPPIILRRRKRGFNMPLNLWLRTDLREWAQEIVFSNQRLIEVFNRRELEKFVTDRLDSARPDVLWPIISLAIWLK